MPRAIWNGQVIAETDEFEVVEGNIYFSPSSIRSEFFTPSDEHTFCAWKGTASYYDSPWTGRRPPAAPGITRIRSRTRRR